MCYRTFMGHYYIYCPYLSHIVPYNILLLFIKNYFILAPDSIDLSGTSKTGNPS